MVRFKKGSEAAKRYMAKIRGMRKGSHVSRSRPSRSRHITKRRSSNMRRRSLKGRRHLSAKIPLSIVGGIIYGMTSGVGGGSVVDDAFHGRWENALKQLSTGVGFNAFAHRIDLGNAKILQGLVVGALIHKGAAKFGLNRAISKIPVVNI